MERTIAKKVCLYGFFTAAALLFGYVEYLVPLNFIAPGIKLGFSNGIVLLLIIFKKDKSAFFINVARIFLSGFLFASLFSLAFSLTAGITSTIAMILLSKLKGCGIIGISVCGSIIHNVTQILVALCTVGTGVFFYLPMLLISGVIAGMVVGLLVWIMCNKLNVNKLFEGVL